MRLKQKQMKPLMGTIFSCGFSALVSIYSSKMVCVLDQLKINYSAHVDHNERTCHRLTNGQRWRFVTVE